MYGKLLGQSSTLIKFLRSKRAFVYFYMYLFLLVLLLCEFSEFVYIFIYSSTLTCFHIELVPFLDTEIRVPDFSTLIVSYDLQIEKW